MFITFIILLTIILFLFQATVDVLNLKVFDPVVPDEFKEIYLSDKYAASQNYLKDKTFLSIVENGAVTAVVILFLYFGGFLYLQDAVGYVTDNQIFQGVIFFLILYVCSEVFCLPFSAYTTFVIEAKYGFNKMNGRIFFMDFIKKIFLSLVLGGVLLFCVLYFFNIAGTLTWLWCLLTVAFFELFVVYISPVLILPLFYKFVALDDGELKNEIEKYISGQNYTIRGIFSVNASKRTTKPNAFFTGFGRNKRIGLFDNLINNFSVSEIVAVLAHEVGHYKKKHMLKGLLISLVTSAVMFILMQGFISSEYVHSFIGIDNFTVHMGLFLFLFVYNPVNYLFGILSNWFSRAHEFEADKYALTSTGDSEYLIAALKKLSSDSLNNLTPHKLKVFTEYTHPPVLHRIMALREEKSGL
ncbi:MAG: M48 family metallopeptidase [Candidatus Omnitrophica bacterium]|nr:M48 family metallopeptidase [Candidatus Omnitrophota bacterium]MDD5081508.1 M48 family metallopeptidase [Candidatus Omnitrophota bacterium]MDD5441443.1 M48 family metallopeptidase [Candidatus Omnitrophota bacterium]